VIKKLQNSLCPLGRIRDGKYKGKHGAGWWGGGEQCRWKPEAREPVSALQVFLKSTITDGKGEPGDSHQ
jgi:hypothetical protein